MLFCREVKNGHFSALFRTGEGLKGGGVLLFPSVALSLLPRSQFICPSDRVRSLCFLTSFMLLR